MSSIFPSEAHRDELLMRLKLLGIAVITVDFSGSGDSGNINDVLAQTADGVEVKLDDQPLMSWMEETSTHNPVTRQWDKSYHPANLSLESILTKMAEQALEETNLDWYNNDGGQGEFTIDFRESPPKIELQVGINYTQTDEHEFVFSGMEMQRGDDEEEDDNAPSPP